MSQLKRVMSAGGAVLMAEEWMPVTNRMDKGKGDLVFCLHGVDFVVEAKYISPSTGHTARVRRTTHRAYVKEQALRYANHWRAQHPDRLVVAVTCTNDEGWVELADD